MYPSSSAVQQSTNQIKLPPFLEFDDEADELRKCLQFKDRVLNFQREIGVENFKVPSIGGRELDLCKFFKAVILRGGSQRVSSNKLWKEIVNEFEIPPSCTSASFTLRNHYNRCLLQFEKQFYVNQGQVDATTGLNADGVPPIHPGVAAILDVQRRPHPYPQNLMSQDMTHGMQPQQSVLRQQDTQNQAAYPQNSRALYPLPSSIAHQQQPQNAQQLHPTSAASVNLGSTFTDVCYPVSLTYTLAESKRLVLAFESRIQTEITWALNSLMIFSCNTAQNLTLENQPYLVESMASYMQYCIEHIEKNLDLTLDIIKKDQKLNISQVQSFVDALDTNLDRPQKLDYRTFGMFTRAISDRREQKYNDKIMSQDDIQAMLGSSSQKKRGRKTKSKLLEEQFALDELRRKRKKLVTILHQEVSELTLINHLKSLVLIIRNLSFIKQNEHHFIKCFKIVDIIISLFVDLADKEISLNCLDIVTNLAKHIVLSEIVHGSELVDTLFQISGAVQIGGMPGFTNDAVDQCIECLRRLSLSAGNECFLEQLRDQDIQSIVNLLVSPNIETREGCLEILCTISDKETTSASLKVRIASQQRCIERLIGLIAAGSSDAVCLQGASPTVTEEKIAKLAALTLVNLNMAPANRHLIAPYEQELALIASCDERTCKIVSEILGDLDSYQVYSK